MMDYLYSGGDACSAFLSGQQVPSAVVSLGYKTVLINNLIVQWLRNRPANEYIPLLQQRVTHVAT